MIVRRRGVALLLVLSTLVIVLPALAILSSRAATLHRQTRQNELAALIDCSLPAIQSRIGTWLTDDSANVVLPLEASTPHVAVDELNWPVETGASFIRITAFDLCGMLPVSVVRDAPLGQRLVPYVVSTLRQEPAQQAAMLGLDGWSKHSVTHGGPSWYPAPDQADAQITVPGSSVAFDLADLEIAPALNVNTAPWPFVEAVARTQGVTDLDRLAAHRASGKRSIPLPRVSARGNGLMAQLVHESNAWAFRVDASSGPARRSWWLVYVKDQQEWRLHRRVPIDA